MRPVPAPIAEAAAGGVEAEVEEAEDKEEVTAVDVATKMQRRLKCHKQKKAIR
jgi:hypothetical protein